jgi:hypothetical protein
MMLMMMMMMIGKNAPFLLGEKRWVDKNKKPVS